MEENGLNHHQNTSPTPGTKRTRSSVRLLIVFICLVLSAFALLQWRSIEEYRLYFTAERKPAMFAFADLSEEWTEKYLRERFREYPMSCENYQGELPVARACGVDVKSHNGVPSLFIAFFFSDGHLSEAVVNVPWWALGEAYDSLVDTLGEPSASQLFPHDDVRLYGWRLMNGSALFLNKDRPLNPLTWNAIYWRSASACEKSGCFNKRSQT